MTPFPDDWPRRALSPRLRRWLCAAVVTVWALGLGVVAVVGR